MRDNGVSRGFGFVCYSTAEAAQNAISAMNNSRLGSQKLFVDFAQDKNQRVADLALERKNRVLYVNGISYHIDSLKLQQIFQPYGHIHACQVWNYVIIFLLVK